MQNLIIENGMICRKIDPQTNLIVEEGTAKSPRHEDTNILMIASCIQLHIYTMHDVSSIFMIYFYRIIFMYIYIMVLY